MLIISLIFLLYQTEFSLNQISFYVSKLISYNHSVFKIDQDSFFIVKMLFVLPILEEISFRLYLQRYKKKYIILSIVATICLFLFLESSLILILYGLLLVIGYLLFFTKNNGFFRLYKGDKLGILISSIFFILSHIFIYYPYTMLNQGYYLLFLILIFVKTYFLVSVRIRLGFVYAILLHFLYNLMPLLQSV
ncbi:CPBP family intramembrane metalloprotease [Galbibacter sp. BG1]|nr:CPBP family intramembrane metalloprotease [Galbibacter sp. BG1]